MLPIGCGPSGGIDFALVLAILAGALEIIPNLGPIMAGVVITLFALLQSPTKALFAAGFFVVLQQVESQVLVPYIMRSQTAVLPLLVVFALVAGGSVGGVLGVLVAIPLAAGLRVFALLVVAPAVRRAMGVTDPQGADGDHREEDGEE